MKVKIQPATFAEKDIVANLMKLYQYDFTELGGEYVDVRGNFEYKYFDSYWEDKSRYPFLIQSGDQLAGFCFVNKHSLIGSTNIHAVAEFFILRYMRGKGVGISAAKEIISLFPGTWEISQTYENLGAQQFWLKVVSFLVGDNYEKVDLKDVAKVVLRFQY